MPLESLYPTKRSQAARLAAARITPDDELDPNLLDPPLESGVGMTVDLPNDPLHTTAVTEDGIAVTTNADGSISVAMGESGEAKETEDFYDNLAEVMRETELDRLASDLIQKFEADEKSMQPWLDRVLDALVLLGVDKDKASNWIKNGAPFEGSSKVIHPMLAEAVVQFNARSLKELMPPTGPTKSYVKGLETQDTRERAERVAKHMNCQIIYEDEGYLDDFDRMLFFLPFVGSAFRKTWWDQLSGELRTRMVVGTEIVCSYEASSLEDAPRITHKFNEQHNDLLKKIRAGIYIDSKIVEAKSAPHNELKDAIKTAEGRVPSLSDDDKPHEMLEMYAMLDLPGFEDTYEEDGEVRDSGIALPYIITIEKTAGKIVSIYRNWSPNDESKTRELWIDHYKFLPGLGMYGFGYLHFIGGLTEAATGSLRALLDSAAFSNGQSGFVTRDYKGKKGTIKLKPFALTHLDVEMEDIRKGIYFPDFKGPSPVMVELLKILEEGGRRFMSTVDVAVGDAKNTGPVGTTVALIEQAQRVMSGVHVRMHRTLGRELRKRAMLNKRYMPDGEQIYHYVDGEEFKISREDYDDDAVHIIPVSDPNITSATEKIAKSQTILQRSEQAPDKYDTYQVERMFLEAIGVSDIDSVLLNPEDIPYTSPLNEAAMLMGGKPIKAFYEQNHDAHLAVHEVALQYFSTLSPEMGLPLIAQMQDHIAKHRAYQLHQQAAVMMGMPSDPIDLYQSQSKEQSLEPQLDNMLAVEEAQRIQALLPMIKKAKAAMEQPQKSAEDERKNLIAQGDEQRKQGAFDSEQQRKDAEFAKEQQRKDEAFIKEEQRKDAERLRDFRRDDAVEKKGKENE